MGASGKMDAKIPPVAGELSLRFKLRPAVRVLACIQLSASPPWRTDPFCALGPITLVSWDGLTSCPGRYVQCPFGGAVHYNEDIAFWQ